MLQIGEEEKIAGYILKVEKLVHLMKDCGKILTDKMIFKNLVSMLTSHFDHVIVAIQESNNLEALKLEDFVVSLEAHQMRIIERKGVQDSLQSSTGSDMKEMWWFQQVQGQRRQESEQEVLVEPSKAYGR